MPQIFTKDDKLREQYRLQEEFVRAQRTERALLKKEREEKEKERITQNSIHFMKKQGCTPEQIAEILGIPLELVRDSSDEYGGIEGYTEPKRLS